MNNDELIKKLQITEEENIKLKQDLENKTIQLNTYLLKNINYYEKHKEEHKQRVKEYQKKQTIKVITNQHKNKKKNMLKEHT